MNEPLLEERDFEYATDCLNSGWISSAGHYLERFEETWASYCERRYGVAVANGTVALQLAVACLDLEPGQEIIMPTFTIVSCALAIHYNGGVPVLVDADPGTWCMDTSQIEAKITNRTRAIMPVHIYGHPVDMDGVTKLADRYGLQIIEDAAEAHGAQCLTERDGQSDWRRCGSFGDMSCFSFYANKPITTGEGGMIVTNSETFAARARSLRNLAFQPAKRFHHDDLGFNFRLTNLQAALGLAQAERADQIVARKRAIGDLYSSLLGQIDGIKIQSVESWAKPIWWMFGLVLDESLDMNATELSEALRNEGIETRPFFLGMHEQPVFQKLGLFRNEKYPVADALSQKGLYLPSGLTLTDSQVERVCEAVGEAIQ